MLPRPGRTGSIVYVKLPGQSVSKKMEVVLEKWKAVLPGVGTETWFVSDIFDRLYKTEDTVTRLVKVFSFVVIAVSIFGLLGLTSFLSERKKKEFGLRKIMGATSNQIYFLFLSEFLKILVLAWIVAMPLSHFLLDMWLENFVYRIELGFSLFFLGASVISGIVFFTVSFEIAKVSRINPVRVVRHE